MRKSRNQKRCDLHAGLYIQDVFGDKLRSEGFCSVNANSISWCRLSNPDVIHTVSFNAIWPRLPLFLRLGFGAYPLFGELLLPESVTEQPSADERCLQYGIREAGDQPVRPYAEDILVSAPLYDGRGLYTLENFALPYLSQATTISDCYQLHKQNYIDVLKKYPDMKFLNMSGLFVDETIYYDDQDLRPFCISKTKQMIEFHQEMMERYPKKAIHTIELELWEQRKRALLDNARSDYLKMLEQRKQDNIEFLKKITKTGAGFA